MVQNVLFFEGMENGFMFVWFVSLRAGINSKNLFQSYKESEFIKCGNLHQMFPSI